MGGGSMTSTSNTDQTTTVKIPKDMRRRGRRITNAAMEAYFDPARQYQPYSYTNIVGQNYGLGSYGAPQSGTSTGGSTGTDSGLGWSDPGYGTGAPSTGYGSGYSGAPLPTSMGYQPGYNPNYTSPYDGTPPPTRLGQGQQYFLTPEQQAKSDAILEQLQAKRAELKAMRDNQYRYTLEGGFDENGNPTNGLEWIENYDVKSNALRNEIDRLYWQRQQLLNRSDGPPAEVGPNGLPITYADIGRDTTAQLNAYHDATAGLFGEAADNWRPYLTDAEGVAASAYGNIGPGQMVDDPNYNWATVSQFMNPFMQGVLNWGYQDIAEQQNQQRLADQSRAAGAGAFGGARHGVVDALNAQTYADNLRRFTDEQLNTGFNQAVGQYNTDFSQKLAAAQANNAARDQDWNRAASLSQIYSNLGKQIQDQTLAAGTANMSLAEVIRQQEQQQKDNAYTKGYLDQRDYPMQIFERLQAINAMQPHNTTTQTTGTTTTETSGSAGAGGVAGAALSAIGGLFSDERAKENVEDVNPEKVLGAFAKVKPKTYDYKSEVREAHPDLAGEGRRIGFMAQDLEKAFKRPSGPTIDGLKTVDTGNLLGSIVAAINGLEKRTRKLRGKV